MNTSRYTAGATVSGNLHALWLYIAAPVTGMYLAYPTCRWIQGGGCCPTDTGGEAND